MNRLLSLILVSILIFFSREVGVCQSLNSLTLENDSAMVFYEDARRLLLEGQVKEAERILIKSIPLLEKVEEIEKLCETYIELSSIYFDQHEYSLAFKYIYLAKSTIENRVGTDGVLYGLCLLNLSAYIYEQNRIAESLSLDKQALNILEKVNHNKGDLAVLYSNLALTLELIGEYDQAIIHIKKALELNHEFHGRMNIRTSECFFDLGYLLLGKGSYPEAISNFQNSLSILKILSNNTIQIPDYQFIQNYQRMALAYQQSDQLDSSMRYLQRAQVLQKDLNSFRKYLTFEIEAENSLVIGNFDEAVLKGIEAANFVERSYSEFQKHPVIARQYTHLGEIYQANSQLDSAVHYFHQAFLYLAHGFENRDIYSNPQAEQCFMEFKVIRSLRGKARALYLRFQESRDLRDLKASLDTYQLTHDFIKKLKEDITTMGSKQRLAGDALEIYEEAIETALALHQETGEEKYLEKALLFAESNKAILLLESMNERIAQSVSGIPDSLLEKEKQFRVDVAYYEREINEENNKKGKEPDQDKIKEWEDKLYTLRREYQQLIDQFEEQYPKYYQLKFDTKLATLQDIRKGMIDRKTAFLEYFVGTKKVYLFEITKSNFKVHQFSKPEGFEEDIKEVHRMVKKPQLSTEEIPSFQSKIYHIYQNYVAAAIDRLPGRINRLLIVPDDLLNLIPFELLSRNEALPEYLIQDYTIGYAYSASLFQASRKQDGVVADQLFLGYAPAFSAPMAENRNCAGDRLANLENSAREVVGIQELLGGEVRIGMEANRDSFLAQAKHYRIIHLATHACMDEENPMQSKVFFADDPIVNQDLFNLNLSADLAVLSACNTGSGQLVKGDGVLSLSKGFVHAGCPSAVMSLWSVDDFSTSEIMIDFYDYLKKGYTKDKALRQAKLDFIATADKVKKHPFFWATFVQMGDPVALDLGQAGFPWQLALGSLIIALIASLWLRNRGKKEKLGAAQSQA